jgi:putative endonuclease
VKQPARRALPGWSVYIVRCGDGTLYTGIALDVRRRIAQHARAAGQGAKYLRGRGPLRLVFARRVGSRGGALRAEHRIKRLPRTRKEELLVKAGRRSPLARRIFSMEDRG